MTTFVRKVPCAREAETTHKASLTWGHAVSVSRAQGTLGTEEREKRERIGGLTGRGGLK
jgi:hypothetical protein